MRERNVYRPYLSTICSDSLKQMRWAIAGGLQKTPQSAPDSLTPFSLYEFLHLAEAHSTELVVTGDLVHIGIRCVTLRKTCLLSSGRAVSSPLTIGMICEHSSLRKPEICQAQIPHFRLFESFDRSHRSLPSESLALLSRSSQSSMALVLLLFVNCILSAQFSYQLFGIESLYMPEGDKMRSKLRSSSLQVTPLHRSTGGWD